MMLNSSWHNAQTALLIGAIAAVALIPNPWTVDYLDWLKRTVTQASEESQTALSQEIIRRAIGHAEGNLTLEGEPTTGYQGHSDPGNDKQNQGWCSDQGRGGGEVARADAECDQYVFGFSDRAATLAEGDSWLELNLLDLWNQAGDGEYQDLPGLYRQHRERGTNSIEAMARARADAFVQAGRQTASGLTQLGYEGNGNAWAFRPAYNADRVLRDQKRRVIALHRVFDSSAPSLPSLSE